MGTDLTHGTRYANRPRQPEVPAATEALRARYRDYRLRQGRELLALVPREAIRSLHQALTSSPAAARDGAADPVEAMVGFCADLLPLPPFGVWLEDFHRNRSAYLAEAGPGLEKGPSSPDGGPVAVELRSFATNGQEWVAALWVHPAPGNGWRGSIHFHRPPDASTVRTADIFREADAEAVRERFRAFDDATLQAFLRSVLP